MVNDKELADLVVKQLGNTLVAGLVGIANWKDTEIVRNWWVAGYLMEEVRKRKLFVHITRRGDVLVIDDLSKPSIANVYHVSLSRAVIESCVRALAIPKMKKRTHCMEMVPGEFHGDEHRCRRPVSIHGGPWCWQHRTRICPTCDHRIAPVELEEGPDGEIHCNHCRVQSSVTKHHPNCASLSMTPKDCNCATERVTLRNEEKS